MKQYNIYMKNRGFTVVELIIVIVSIAILASITLASYNSSRDSAMDARIRSTARTVGDAIALHESKNGSLSFAEGALGKSSGADSALIPKYLRTGYRDDITSKNSASANDILVWYPCSDSSGGFAVFASLNDPKEEDIANLNKLRTDCFETDAIRNSKVPITGSTKYNFAQMF